MTMIEMDGLFALEIGRSLPAARVAHVKGVAAQAARFPAGSGSLVEAAWLHDVGYAPEARVTGMHAIDGALLCRARGVSAEVVSLVAWHTGAVYEAQERGLVAELNHFPLPDRNLIDALTLL